MIPIDDDNDNENSWKTEATLLHNAMTLRMFVNELPRMPILEGLAWFPPSQVLLKEKGRANSVRTENRGNA